MRESKKNYFYQYFDEHKNNMKMPRKGIKIIVIIGPGNFDSVMFLKEENGSTISDPVKIANECNKYFANVADNITGKVPRVPKSPLDYLSNPNLDSFFVSPCTAEEISSCIQSLKTGKPGGPNNILVELLNILDLLISKYIAVLIDESFLTGTLPAKQKIAKVIPIF